MAVLQLIDPTWQAQGDRPHLAVAISQHMKIAFACVLCAAFMPLHAQTPRDSAAANTICTCICLLLVLSPGGWQGVPD